MVVLSAKLVDMDCESKFTWQTYLAKLIRYFKDKFKPNSKCSCSVTRCELNCIRNFYVSLKSIISLNAFPTLA